MNSAGTPIDLPMPSEKSIDENESATDAHVGFQSEATPNLLFHCPDCRSEDGLVLMGNQCFYMGLEDTIMTWEENKQFCKTNEWRMAILNSTEDQKQLLDNAKAKGRPKLFSHSKWRETHSTETKRVHVLRVLCG